MDLAYWGFECKCEACDEGGDYGQRFQSGEARRKRMYELNQNLRCFDERVSIATGIKGAAEALGAVRVLADLFVLEGVVGRDLGGW